MNQFINKKQLGVTLILIGLMMVLFLAQKGFNDRLKLVMLMDSNITNLKEYSIGTEGYSYSLPAEWTTNQKSYPGSYIVYHNSFRSESMGIIGYVEVMNSKDGLEHITISDGNKLPQNKVKEYKSLKTKINDKEGYRISYKLNLDEGKLVYDNVYYIKVDEEKYFKLLFSVGEEKYKENLLAVFDAIVETCKVNK
ncbi:hypothetical protein CPJCM30710_17000 [Clostridium polyendosporum]|uniref:PsbP protein n=1 Tax=Clostridium polyendosporum TaxID=69208 RepID=A0A919RZC7_9CLOT|nr:PsbP-related protein [Clostridium polyendosporum]GIM29034.1 hypothetical protein CPJCM30710_17000 [Clostridium polyendosporum]